MIIYYIIFYIIKLFLNVQVIKSPHELRLDFNNLLKTVVSNSSPNHYKNIHPGHILSQMLLIPSVLIDIIHDSDKGAESFVLPFFLPFFLPSSTGKS
jgi:hypothetical protein